MNSNVKVAAGIVVYNPEKKRLNECLDKLKEQVEVIYIFDNSDLPINDMNISDSNIEYMTENKNCGIAHALNKIMEKAKQNGYQWVITMDQDSLIPDGMIEGFKSSITQHSNVGIICPQVIDKRRVYIEFINNDNEEFIDFCITSGSCTSIEAWEKCGKFDEWLFIDLVDNDFCKRLILSGYKILKLNKWILDQEFGKIIPKTKNKQMLWLKISKILHNPNFAKFSYKKFVSPLRVYYTNRNIIYLNKKLKKYGNVGYENYNCKTYMGFIVCFLIPSILRAQNKRRVIKSTINGIKDGKLSNPVMWVAQRKDLVGNE